MSGETEEMTADEKSVESALIWTDNPELEYFRSIMTNGTDDNLASGDSLIGDSTVREMLEIGGGSPFRRTGGRDTSGLSDTESNTVDNIYIEDGSTFAKKKTFGKIFDDGTIESPENEDLVPPTMRNPDSQDQGPNPNEGNESHDKSPTNSRPQCVFSPAQIINVPHDVYHGDTEVTGPPKIPGFIFVTDGHPSIVHTSPEIQEDQPSKQPKRQKVRCIPRSRIVCLIISLVVASTVIAVLMYRFNLESPELTSSSSQKQNDGSPFTSPQSPPTSEPSGLRATNRPQQVVSTSAPSTSELDSRAIPSTEPSIYPSPSILTSEQTLTPTIEPTTKILNSPAPTVSPTDSPTDSSQVPTSLPTMVPSSLSSATSSMVNTPSSCVSTIATNKTCYESGESIQISFNNCVPESTDWIGIYRARQGTPNFNQALTWVWACGDRFCNDSVSRGELTLNDNGAIGNFQAFLFRDDGRNSIIAIGNSFSITSRCNSNW